MANGDEEPSRPRSITAANVWEAFDRLREDTREARHVQNNQFQRTIHDTGESIRTEIRQEIGGMDSRLRKIEDVVTAASPVSLGGRINDLERALAKADGDSALHTRLNSLETWRDELRGSLAFIKIGGIVVALLSGLASLLSWLSLQRPV